MSLSSLTRRVCVRALKEADAAHVVMLEKLGERVEQVQQHLVRQDQQAETISAGIAELKDAGVRAAESHRSTMHAVRLTLFSTVLSAVVGIGVVGIEHVLIK